MTYDKSVYKLTMFEAQGSNSSTKNESELQKLTARIPENHI
ncbi:hypothetical protein [Methanolobus vulcani]|nr:hypothetical protein [Methanolobus vulcani]